MSANSKQNDQNPENDVYKLVSVAIILIFVAILSYVMLGLAGVSFNRDDPQQTPTETTDAEPSKKPPSETKPDEPPIETQTSDAETQTEPETSEATPESTEPDPYLDGDEPVEDVFSPSELEELYPDAVLTQTSDLGREYLDRIVFLGDSTTYGLARYSMLRGGRNTKQVWTPLSGTLTLWQATMTKIYYPDDDCELLISEAVERKKPEILVVTLGVNGIAIMKEDYFVSEYEKLINSVMEKSPDTKIILQSIFPVASSYRAQEQINNEKITAANGWIAALADKLGIWYLDTYSALVGEDGYLPEEYQNGDGMHLNETSFTIELNYIRTHGIPDYAANADESVYEG